MNRIYRSNLYIRLMMIVLVCGAFLLSLLFAAWPDAPHWIKSLTQYVLLFGLPSFLFMRWFHLDLSSIGARLPKRPVLTVLLAVPFAFLIQPPLMLISAVMERFFPNPVAVSMTSILADPLPLALLGTVLLPAVFEEWVCRGIYLCGYRDRHPLLAAFFSALVFAMIHLNLHQFLYAFCFGFVIALACVYTGSLLFPVLVHAIVNGTQILTAYYDLALFPDKTGSLALVSLICLVPILGILLLLRGKPEEPNYDTSLDLRSMLPLAQAFLIFLLMVLLLR